MNTMISFGNDWTVFFTRPISGTVMALVVVTLALPVYGAFRSRRNASA
jgi:putative tricarboxylic transport membrane protein